MIIDEQELLRIAKLSGFDIYPEDNEVWFNCEYDLTENIHMFVDLLEKSIKQKPLSDGELPTNNPKINTYGERLAFHTGIRWAEHQHGIRS